MTKKKNTKQSTTTSTHTNGVGTVSTTKAAAVATTYKRKAPAFKANENGNLVIAHSEYLTDINGTTSANAISFTINPQDATCFTWLAPIATRFEFYRFKRMRLVYKPSCATTQAGYVIFGVDFDFYDSAPTKITMMNWKFATKTSYYQPAFVDITPGLAQSSFKYCNSGTGIPGDLRMSHLGQVWILTDQAGSTFNAGELFIDYTVEFKQPSLQVPPALFASFTADPSWRVLTPTNVDIKYVTGNTFLLNTPGKYLVEAISNWTTSISTSSISFTTPSTRPDTEYTSVLSRIVTNATDSIASYILDLQAGAVNIILNLAGTGTLTPFLRLSTYVDGK